MGEPRFDARTALITCAGAGIGKACAQEFAARGAPEAGLFRCSTQADIITGICVPVDGASMRCAERSARCGNTNGAEQ